MNIVLKLCNSKNISIFLKKKKHTQLLKIRTSLLLNAINANCQSKQLIMEDTEKLGSNLACSKEKVVQTWLLLSFCFSFLFPFKILIN